MTPKMEVPATLAACGAPKADLAGASITSEDTSPLTDIQVADELARLVFGRGFLVVREPIGDRFRRRAPSRIRAWRAQ